MLFTPYEPGYYSIAVSIENSMGKFLGQEIFNYNVINKKKNLVSLNNGVLKKRKKNTLKKKEIKTNFYTIQVSSWNKIEDAEKEMAKLNRLGYKSYIDKKNKANKIFYRVRINETLTYNESLEMKNKLKKYGWKDIWIDKNKK